MTTATVERPAPRRMQSQELEAVRRYWDHHVHDWKVAKSEAGTKEFFAEIAVYRYDKLHYLKRVVDFAGFAGKRVVDLGCGVGNDLALFAKGGATCYGADLAEHSINLATRNFEQRGLRGQFFVGNGQEFAAADESFDVVFCHTVLHFTPEPEGMIREIHRVLRPDGVAILMTVNRRSWMNFLSLVMRVELDHQDSPIFREYTRGEFSDMLRPFEHVRIVPERFPVASKVHHGFKAKLYNGVFVGAFNLLPRSWVRWSGHHLMAFASKRPRAEVVSVRGGRRSGG